MFADHVKEDLHNCLKCGMCQAVCPTFKATFKERHAPRGRVQLVKHYLEGDLSVTKGLHEALMSCIQCESCAEACPSGVRLDRVWENMRMELHEQYGTKLPKRALFAALKNPLLMRLGAKLAYVGQKAVLSPLNIQQKVGNIPLNRFPSFNSRPFRVSAGRFIPPVGKRRGRVLYFTGCATDLINEHVGHAVVDVLTSLGYEVEIPQEQVCCSVPVFLSGARREALPSIEKNLALFDRDDADAIVVDCATCGGGLKKAIPNLMEDLGLDTEKALRVAGKVRDISEIAAAEAGRLELDSGGKSSPLTVTYHDPCHLVRSMHVSAEPRKLIETLDDVQLVEMVGADQCCGGAGAFQFEHPDLSASVTSRKRENILQTEASLVATGCPGCSLTLGGNLHQPGDPAVTHTICLVAERLRNRRSRAA